MSILYKNPPLTQSNHSLSKRWFTFRDINLLACFHRNVNEALSFFWPILKNSSFNLNKSRQEFNRVWQVIFLSPVKILLLVSRILFTRVYGVTHQYMRSTM